MDLSLKSHPPLPDRAPPAPMQRAPAAIDAAPRVAALAAIGRQLNGDGAAPVQLARISAGFDRVSSAADPDEDTLVTTGLANCIAVAAQDQNTGRAVMGHLNTAFNWNNRGAMTAFRSLLVTALRGVAGATPAPVFHVSLGRSWLSGTRNLDDPVNNGWLAMRHTLIGNCIAVFGTEPVTAGETAEFDLATGTMEGSGAVGTELGLVPPPDDDPHGTAGDVIPYARLGRTNVRGHKLDRDLNALDHLSLAMRPGDVIPNDG